MKIDCAITDRIGIAMKKNIAMPVGKKNQKKALCFITI